MLKKIVLKIINAISILAIAASVIVLLMVVLTRSGEAPRVMGYSVFRVMTGSMEPTIQTDSLIAVKKIEPSQVKEGDIISFYSQDPAHGGAVNTHRVMSVEQNGDTWTYETKGDANQVVDQYPVSAEDLIGKVVFVSYPLGVAVHLLSNPLIFTPGILVPLFFILIYNISRTILLTRGLVQEEEESAVREAVEAIRRKRAGEDSETDDNKK